MLQTGIELSDQMSAPLQTIIGNVNNLVSQMGVLQSQMAAQVSTAGLDNITSAAHAAADAVNSISWTSDAMPTFTTTGIERWRQETESAQQMMQKLADTQTRIAQQSFGSTLLPNNAAQDLVNLSTRLDAVQQKIQKISQSKLNLGSSEASNEMEKLRQQMAECLDTQEELNNAINNMDVSGANAAYLKLSQQTADIERNIRDNTTAQGQFTQSVQQSTTAHNGLLSLIAKIGGTYLSFQGVKGIFDASDSLVSTTARINQMNDGLQSTQDLMNMTYTAAQNARGSFSDMADVVARFGNNAGDAFDSSAQVVEFAELVQKEMTIAGASTENAANAELQLSQALGSGVLRGDELNSIFEQAPNLIQAIADYLGVPIGQIKEMASEGELTADTVKNAILSSADEINAEFNAMPMTWSQLWTEMKNSALIAFQPVLEKINELANNPTFQAGIENIIELVSNVAIFVLDVIEQIGAAASWVADNWSVIEPIVIGVATAVGVLAATVAVYNAVQAISNGIGAIHAAITGAQAATTATATAAQTAYNSALAACPIMWIIALIIMVIAAIVAVCQAVAQATGLATTGFGIITGGINIVIQFVKNLGLTVANIALGIWNAMSAVATNIQVAFHNSIANVQSFFYNLLSTAASVIEGIAAALNQLPFVEFDYSGITAAADDYAAKAQAAADSKEEYTDISDAFSSGMSTYDTFQDDWQGQAFDDGAAWGDGVSDGVSSALSSFTDPSSLMPDTSAYQTQLDSTATDFTMPDNIAEGIEDSGLADSAASTAGSAADCADALDATDEDLKYLRDVAEMEAINRYTLATVNVDMSGMNNNVTNGMDIDDVLDNLTRAVNNSIDEITEGVHK